MFDHHSNLHPSWLLPLLHISTWSHSCCSHLAWLAQFKVNHHLENTNFLVIVIATVDAIPLLVFTTVPYLKCVFANDLCPEARQMVYSQPPQNAQFFPSKFATTIEYDAYFFFIFSTSCSVLCGPLDYLVNRQIPPWNHRCIFQLMGKAINPFYPTPAQNQF